MKTNRSAMLPFEICSIRPPTENNSLTFRLTRNCYWNKCAFCPVYKFGARFSRRGLEEVKEDIRRARNLNDILVDRRVPEMASHGDSYGLAHGSIERLLAEIGYESTETENQDIQDDLDPRLVWFLSWFKDKPDIKDSLHHLLAWHMGGGTTCFLGDADSLILKPEFLNAAISEVKSNFPTIDRFTVYGRSRSAARSRKLKEMIEYRRAGLDRIHFGLESGSDQVLKMVNKGETRDDHIEGGIKTREAGISCSVYVMPGLGGTAYSDSHVRDTADVINRMTPDFIRLRSLQIFPQTPLAEARQAGEFIEADEVQIVGEIRNLVAGIDIPAQLYSDSAVNLVPVHGKLPEDRPAMLKKLDHFLSLSRREQLIYSLESRLSSFTGQYGGVTQDLYQILVPYLKDRNLDYDRMSDAFLQETIQLIRSKLMP